MVSRGEVLSYKMVVKRYGDHFQMVITYRHVEVSTVCIKLNRLQQTCYSTYASNHSRLLSVDRMLGIKLYVENCNAITCCKLYGRC